MNYERLYEYRFRNVDQAARDAVWKEIGLFLYERLGRPERVLDPAAGRGEFISSIPARERWAVDEVAYPEIGRDTFTTVLTGSIMDVELPESHFDGVFASNFLEHLSGQEAVAGFLERMHRTLRPGGRIAVMGPNYRYLRRGEYWNFADHVVPLTDLAVEEHLYAAGFEPQRTEPRFLPYSFTGRLPASRRLTRLYLRVPLAWRVLGKQFLVMASR
jgi:SAM-dependent methyltransferase